MSVSPVSPSPRARNTWTQTQVVSLVSIYEKSGIVVASHALGRSEAEVRAKLEALGLLKIDAADRKRIDDFVASHASNDLALRYLIATARNALKGTSGE